MWTYKDARRMGIVILKHELDWMSLRRKIAEHWSHDWEQILKPLLQTISWEEMKEYMTILTK